MRKCIASTMSITHRYLNFKFQEEAMRTDCIEGLRKNIGCFFTEKADSSRAILKACDI